MSAHLQIRNGKYSFRLRVPHDCRAQLGVEITRDLGTAITRDAERLARVLATEYRGLFAAIRASSALGRGIEDAKAIARKIADHQLAKLQGELAYPLDSPVATSQVNTTQDAAAGPPAAPETPQAAPLRGH